MRSLKYEQVAVIKFLTLDGFDEDEIYKRLKIVFHRFTLSNRKVSKLHKIFIKEGLLGNEEDNLYFESMQTSHENIDNNFTNMQIQLFDKIKIEDYDQLPVTDRVSLDLSSSEMNDYSYNTDEVGLESNLIDNQYKGGKRSLCDMKSNLLVDRPTQNKKREFNTFHFEFEEATDNLPFINTTDTTICQKILYGIHSLKKPDISCLLCTDKSFLNFSRLKRHLQEAHIKHSIVWQSMRVLICKKYCTCDRKKNLLKKAHYHCFKCSNFFYDRKRITNHYQYHNRHTKKHLTIINGINEKLHRRPLCIDSKEGLFLVKKSKFHNKEIIHVKRKTITTCEGEIQVISSECSEDLCIESMEIARINGKQNLECKHLLIPKDEDYKEYPLFFSLNNESFQEIKIKPLDQQRCLDISKFATIQQKPLVVEWVEDENTVFFSVISDDTTICMGRVIVKLDLSQTNYIFVCKCHMNNTKFCVSKAIAEIYFHSAK